MEHILPQWLLKMTGDENRQGNFGIIKDKNNPRMRQYAFSSFKFPSCEVCNSDFSKLESKAKVCCGKIIEGKNIGLGELNSFFDWFDKIRVGIWLANYSLDKNYFAIKPNYHIEKRIRLHDRALFVNRHVDSTLLRLTVTGSQSPCFSYTPSCFGLVINNFSFLNVSYNFLISKRMGWPFGNGMSIREDRKMLATLNDGTQVVKERPLNMNFSSNFLEFYQPAYKYIEGIDGASKYYDNPWLQSEKFTGESWVGSIYRRSKISTIRKVTDEVSFQSDENESTDRESQIRDLTFDVLKVQKYLNGNQLGLKDMDPKEREYLESALESCRKFNDWVIEEMKKEESEKNHH